MGIGMVIGVEVGGGQWEQEREQLGMGKGGWERLEVGEAR